MAALVFGAWGQATLWTVVGAALGSFVGNLTPYAAEVAVLMLARDARLAAELRKRRRDNGAPESQDEEDRFP